MPTPVPSYRKQPPKLVGGDLCLDFVNTVSWRGDTHEPGDRLTHYSELLLWAVHAGVLDKVSSRTLEQEADRRPDEAQAVVELGVALREALARLFPAGRARAESDLATLNACLASAPPRSTLRARGSGYAWEDSARDGAHDATLRSLLWPVLWSAADLLTSPRRSSVRRCGDPRCGWLFLDTSPTGRRRWCSMEACGNRAKARRHHRATRKTKSVRSRRG
jgi:predicted RNA-binding Zn ribbon-like protein